jgi:hypothetical protein
MCPACITTAAMIAASSASGVGVLGLLVIKYRSWRRRRQRTGSSDRSTFQAELDALRVREKAHMKAGDAVAAARRRLPMVEIDGSIPLIGDRKQVALLDAFEGRRMLIAYYFMWYPGRTAAQQYQGCTYFTSQVRELSYIHARDVTYATVCQGPYEEGARYRDFMGWKMPWYSASQESLERLLVGRRVGSMHLVCYLRQRANVYENDGRPTSQWARVSCRHPYRRGARRDDAFQLKPIDVHQGDRNS